MPSHEASPTNNSYCSMAGHTLQLSHPGFLRVVAFAACALVAGIGLTVVLQRQAQQSFQGVLEAKPYELTADDQLLISKVHKKTGNAIRKGEVVVTLADDGIREELAKLDLQITALKGECEQLTAQAELEIGSSKRAIDQQIYSAQMQLAEYQQAVYAAEVTAMAWEQVLKKDDQQRFASNSLSMVPDVTLRQISPEEWLADKNPEQETILTMLKYASTMNSLEVSKTQVSLCETRLAQLDAEVQQAKQLVFQALGIANKQAQLEQLEARRIELESTLGNPELISPVNGLMGDCFVRAKQAAHPGQTLVSIYDLDQMTIDAQIDTTEIGNFATGQKVTLIFPGNFESNGRVREIARVASNSGKAATPVEKTYVNVVIEPHGAHWPEVPLGSVVKIRVE